MSQWEKDLIADQLRRGVSPSEVMDGVRARAAETAAAVDLAGALVNPKLPRNHDFRPDPETPAACIVCALHPQWHRDSADAPDSPEALA